MKKNKIKVIAASIRGPMHINKNLPCQDFCRYETRSKNFVAIVSDGAGSAKYGKIGAKIICDTMIDLLKNIQFDEAREAIKKAISISRSKICRHRLNKTKDEAGMMAFSATIVGIIYFGGKGLFFHIGDGAALAFRNGGYDDFVASPPENGNFSCETYFYTQANWMDNLRFTPLENAHTIFLMTDGLTNFSFAPDFRNIEKGFVMPINKFLEEESSRPKATKILANTLNNAKAKRLNSDDKTLLWARL